MAAEAVGHRLEQRGLRLLAREPEQPAGGLANGEHVVPVDALTVDPIGTGALVELRLGRRLLHRRAHAVEVVDHLEDDRQAPQGGEIQRFVKRARVGGTVAEVTEHRAVRVPIVERERDAGRNR